MAKKCVSFQPNAAAAAVPDRNWATSRIVWVIWTRRKRPVNLAMRLDRQRRSGSVSRTSQTKRKWWDASSRIAWPPNLLGIGKNRKWTSWKSLLTLYKSKTSSSSTKTLCWRRRPGSCSTRIASSSNSNLRSSRNAKTIVRSIKSIVWRWNANQLRHSMKLKNQQYSPIMPLSRRVNFKECFNEFYAFSYFIL